MHMELINAGDKKMMNEQQYNEMWDRYNRSMEEARSYQAETDRRYNETQDWEEYNERMETNRQMRANASRQMERETNRAYA